MQRLVAGPGAAEDLVDRNQVQPLGELRQVLVQLQVAQGDEHGKVIGADQGHQVGLSFAPGQLSSQDALQSGSFGGLELACGLDDLLEEGALEAGRAGAVDVVRFVAEHGVRISPGLPGCAEGRLDIRGRLTQRRVVDHGQALQFRERERMAERSGLGSGEGRQGRQLRIVFLHIRLFFGFGGVGAQLRNRQAAAGQTGRHAVTLLKETRAGLWRERLSLVGLLALRG